MWFGVGSFFFPLPVGHLAGSAGFHEAKPASVLRSGMLGHNPDTWKSATSCTASKKLWNPIRGVGTTGGGVEGDSFGFLGVAWASSGA